MDFVDINSPYHILVISIILYLLGYDRRVGRGERDMKINLLLEKILFPFSKMGKAALISIIIAAYIEFSLPVSYIAIGILKAPVYKVNIIWNMGTASILFLGTGLSIFYEVPASGERKVLKAIVYMIAVGCIGYGCERLIALITTLLTKFSNAL